MKQAAWSVVHSQLLGRTAAGVAASLLLVGSVVAGSPGPDSTVSSGEQGTQARMLGKKAVMHVYSYAPKTLEITSVISHFFKDIDACESAVGGALRAATSRTSAGDLVDAQCVAVDASEATAQPEQTHLPREVTDL
jgi:hypothetical protein